MKYKTIALIPARSGSQRLKNKNILKIANKHLIGYSIETAIKSKIFDYILVSTDSKKYALIAKKYGAEVPFLRPKKISTSISPDYEWVNFTLKNLKKKKLYFKYFFILRPTNPFRTAVTIKRAWKLFKSNKSADSLRAIEECKQHPEKMWKFKNKFISPLFNKKYKKQPSYNMQSKVFEKIYVQNASLEISKTSNLEKYKTITGKNILGFLTKKNEGLDINYFEDFLKAKQIKSKT